MEENALVELIESRQSVGRVRPEAPPRVVVERLIEAASHAPNHFLTQPWRFIVVAGYARADLGHVMADALGARGGVSATPVVQADLEREAAKPQRAPVIIVVAVEPSHDPRVVEIEEIEAGAAAVENLLLAAHALGLGAKWRTGEAAYDPRVKIWLGLKPGSHIAGFVYLGYPERPGRPTVRVPAANNTRWLGWE